MALTTRCPQCGTAFNVVPDQLRVRNGLVRCGVCNTVFDGRACLLSEEAPIPTLVESPAVPEAPRAVTPVTVPEATTAAAPVVAPPAHPFSAPFVAPTQTASAISLSESGAAAPPAVLRGRTQIQRQTPQAIDEPADYAEIDDDDDSPVDLYAEDLIVANPWREDPPSVVPVTSRDTPYGRPQEHAQASAIEPVWHDTPMRARDSEPARPSEARPDVSRPGRADPVHEDPVFTVSDHDHATIDRDDLDDDDLDSEDDLYAEPVLGEARTRFSSATDVGRAPPEFLDEDRLGRGRILRQVLGYACLIGLIALALQLVFVYRTSIANTVPVVRPVLELACQSLGCTVGYARRLERISITSSSLQPPTGAAALDDGRARLVLTLVLRNRYDKPQHWPALVLDLTDLSDTVVVRKVLMPENYLTPEQARGPFAPDGELKVSVPFEVTGMQVNGYQLDKFFP